MPHHLRRQIDAVRGRTNSSTVPSGAVGVDMQLDLLARRVFSLVGNQFQVVEAEVRAVEPFADDGEDVAPFDRVLLVVGQLVRQPILPGFARL